jgi:osmotically-inducible protein OsmY
MAATQIIAGRFSKRAVARKADYYVTMFSSSFEAVRAVARGTLLFTLMVCAAACGRPDSEVEAAVKAQLAKDSVTAPLKLSLEVRRGVVYVVGETRTFAEQERVTEIARSIEGVKDVTNAMRITDGVLVEEVKKALAADPVVASVPIDVDSRNGFVRLMSDATNREQRERAVALAKKVDGVKNVEDRMR